ncbi:MAG: lipocalin family protein [Ignavibacteriae bacterium]|nr:lipocalin family protein [Ignavibacteriota bacterium]
MKIITTVFSVLIFLLLFGSSSYASSRDSVQTISKESLCREWVLTEYYENGKIQDIYDYEIEFKKNGKYKEEDDGEAGKGTWELNENSTSFIFDKNTLDQDEWIIESFSPDKLVVKFSDEDKNYKFVLVPYK